MKAIEPSPPGLRALQRWMQSLIVHPGRLETSPGDARLLAALLDARDRDAAVERLRVHVRGYPERIREALADAHPAVAHVIGAHGTAALARRFLRARPPRSWSLNDAGAGLAAFLRTDALASAFPFLPDLAELEWRVLRAFHAPQETPLDPARLAVGTLGDWRRARVRLQRGTALVRSAWPIREIWSARRTPLEEIDVDLVRRPDRVMVRRSGTEVVCESVGEGEAVALEEVLAGRTLGEVAARLADEGAAPADVSAWFARWTRLGLVAGVRPGRS
jgi:hypothetical protein